jgi:hemolysin D
MTHDAELPPDGPASRPSAPPPPPPRGGRKPPRRSDRAFLPAAIEILETPPSPVGMALMALICAFVAVAVGWAYVSRIDIIAVAQGKLQPTGRVKVVQPLETSRVLAIHAENGQAVHAGDVLVDLDSREAMADVAGLEANLAAYRAERLRRRAAITAAAGEVAAIAKARDAIQETRDAIQETRDAIKPMPDAAARAGDATPNTPDAPTNATPTNAATTNAASAPREPIVWPSDIPDLERRREERVYAADLAQLDAQIASFLAQADQKRAERARLTAMIAAQNELIKTLDERVAMKSRLVAMNAGSKADLIDATETLQEQRTTLALQEGQRAEATANLAVYDREIARVVETFIADNAQKEDDAERQADDLAEKRAKARARLDGMTLRAPIDGTVQASTLTTRGQIVTSGEAVMRVVPREARLEIECYLPNKDVGFVKPGQDAVVKVESFPSPATARSTPP